MTVTSILSATAMTTYAAAKSRLNAIGVQIVDADSQNEVERLINAVSDATEKYCDRLFRRVLATEQYEPPRGQRLQLDRYPVSTAAADAPVVTLDGASIADAEIEDAERGYLWRESGWQGATHEDSVRGSVSLATLPQSAERVLLVRYSGGYVLPKDEVAYSAGPPIVVAVPRTLPWDLEEAIIVSVAVLWRARLAGYATDSGLGGDRNVGIGRGLGGLLPDAVLPVLDGYRRWR